MHAAYVTACAWNQLAQADMLTAERFCVVAERPAGSAACPRLAAGGCVSNDVIAAPPAEHHKSQVCCASIPDMFAAASALLCCLCAGGCVYGWQELPGPRHRHGPPAAVGGAACHPAQLHLCRGTALADSAADTQDGLAASGTFIHLLCCRINTLCCKGTRSTVQCLRHVKCLVTSALCLHHHPTWWHQHPLCRHIASVLYLRRQHTAEPSQLFMPATQCLYTGITFLQSLPLSTCPLLLMQVPKELFHKYQYFNIPAITDYNDASHPVSDVQTHGTCTAGAAAHNCATVTHGVVAAQQSI
jgi:hypothetical protein